MFSKSYWWKITLAASLATVGWSATFGTVVSIGGHASDLALDEPRGVLYIANFTANRVEVMSLASNAIRTSINVAAQPSSLALSPDGRFLVVAHYGPSAPPASSNNAITVIDLTTSGKQTFALNAAPLGVAFGIDGLALVVTSTDFLLLDPVSGTTQEIDTIAGVVAKTLPVPPANFPADITAASVAASADGLTIYGLGGSTSTVTFRYDVNSRTIRPGGVVTSTGILGPRVVSLNSNGSLAFAGWVMVDTNGTFINYFPQHTNKFAVGTTLFDDSRGVVYVQIPEKDGEAPLLRILDTDNLTLRERLQLRENLTGKSVLSSNASTMYAISDSGLTILPVGNLNRQSRIAVQQEDLVFRGNFCDRRAFAQTLTIVDPSGGNTAFSISGSTSGISVSPSSGVTPATVSVVVNPSAFQNQNGTVTATLQINSPQAVNIAPSVRVLINNRQPEQRGTFVDVPGTLTDIIADPFRNRFFIVRSDRNQVLAFDATNNRQIATLRTGNQPSTMAISFDRRYLLVGNLGSQIVNVFDLETLQATDPVLLPSGFIAYSIASSSNATLAQAEFFDGTFHLLQLDLNRRNGFLLPSLGIFKNDTNPNTVLAASPNGASILVAQADGGVYLYDANVGSFTVSRKDLPSLSGSYAASDFNQYVVGANLFDSSLVPVMQFETGTGTPSGFAFVDQFAFRTTSPSPTGGGQSTSPGVIQRLDVTNPSSSVSRATRIVEAPLLGSTGSPFTRTLAPIYDRSSIANLTVSGFTVLPWTYDASVAPPHINSIVNAADLKPGIAPGGLITLFGTQMSPVNLASSEMPLPTALADSCLTVNGLPVPILFVSPNQINAQMPFETVGNVSMILRTPGGSSDTYNLQVVPGAPSVFRSGVAGPVTDIPTIIRDSNGELVTDSDPIHRNDILVIFLTGLGVTSPAVPTGMPSPLNPLAIALTKPSVTIGGMQLPLSYYGLAPGEVGVYQINVRVPANVPTGISVPLAISQGNYTSSMPVRVVE
jgi:uncharacterized protein (TIGR03437 family)